MKFLTKKNIKLAVLFLGLYLGFLVVTLPAKVIPYFIPENAGVNVANLEGSLWSGEASQIAYQQEYIFNKVQWSVDWFALFTLKVKLNFSFDNGKSAMSGKGAVLMGFSGVSVENVVLDTTADEILRLSKQRVPAKISGPVSLVIHQASQGTPYCGDLDAQLNWQQAIVISDFGSVKLNNPTLDLHCEEGEVVAVLIQESDEISTKATVTLAADNFYKLSGSVKGKNKLDPNIQQTLGWIGPKNADGSTSFKFNGRL